MRKLLYVIKLFVKSNRMKGGKFENDGLFQCFEFSAVCRSLEETKNLHIFRKQ